MAITFDQISPTTRTVFVGAEFDSSQSQQGPSILAYRALLIGQKITAGAAAANTLVRVSSVDQVIAAAGRGSMLHNQAIDWYANNKATELWLGVLADDGAGTAATGTIVVSGPATAAGTIALYLGGERITVGVASGDAATAIATAIAAAVNAAVNLPVTAGASTATVTLTHRHKGLVGNSYDVRHSFASGEALPAGVGLTITAVGGVVAGAGNPSLTTLIAAMGDMWFHVIAHPYTDATSLSAIEAEMLSRSGPDRQIDGLAITSAAGSFSTLTTLGGARNSRYSAIVAQPGPAPLTPPSEFAAAFAAVTALSATADPARPLQTLQLAGVVAPPEQALWTSAERNLLLFDGIATTVRAAGAAVQIDRAITTYQTSPAGSDDEAYLDVATIFTLLYLRHDFNSTVKRRWPRHKLADDGTRFGAGQAIVTPKTARAAALVWFREKEEQGLVEGYAQFARDLVVERNAANRNRLDFLLPPDLINQLVMVATKFQFRK